MTCTECLQSGKTGYQSYSDHRTVCKKWRPSRILHRPSLHIFFLIVQESSIDPFLGLPLCLQNLQYIDLVMLVMFLLPCSFICISLRKFSLLHIITAFNLSVLIKLLFIRLNHFNFIFVLCRVSLKFSFMSEDCSIWKGSRWKIGSKHVLGKEFLMSVSSLNFKILDVKMLSLGFASSYFSCLVARIVSLYEMNFN